MVDEFTLEIGSAEAAPAFSIAGSRFSSRIETPVVATLTAIFDERRGQRRPPRKVSARW
ncbi:hypothetical protein KY092_18225 [Natronomonas gomsonensis]|uniref:hypothetical protein n=1 Tax=Natronomonas gomsonensis TaxID=1046043 RepID=UPI0020CA2805|nr:hypothetical protein [Natronomonas gomsonensis]MCY4732482.1 hypothetical protein [Natronomonas gomsonensis]